MVKKQEKRKHDIRSKLIAAICMLLVASIMMVSSTYAWFTLSTAPEVKGVQTTVGSNGNLEMALIPNGENIGTLADALAAITSAVGDSKDAQGKSAVTANVTWGNLVDLADAGYGLGNIVLYPAALSGAFSQGNYLDYPAYGNDGRVTGLKPATLNGLFANGAFYDDEAYGVRAVGTSSGMSARELAYRSALAAANLAASNANTAASVSMSDGGTSLADIAMKRAQNAAATYTKTEVQALLAVFNGLVADGGAMDLIETALRQYVLAYYYGHASGEVSDAAVSAITTGALSSIASYGDTSSVDSTITAYDTMVARVTDAISGLTTLLADAADSYTWVQIGDYAKVLGDPETMKLCNQTLEYWLRDEDGDDNPDNFTELYNAQANGGLVLDMASGGIYNDIADFCGKVTSNVVLSVSFGGLTLNGVKANMNANTTVATTYLTVAQNAAKTTEENIFGAGSSAPISDYYGYILDLAFRTNASDSYLQLQTTAKDRIYEENTANEDTLGGGSTMTFTGPSSTAAESMMANIRVVFFDTASNAILGYARLDTDTTSMVETNGSQYEVTMSLKMWDNTAGTFKTGDDAAKIVDLTANEAKAVSALVYLDGTTITNADVSTGEMDAKLNLQFSSSAELKPMDYSALLVDNND